MAASTLLPQSVATVPLYRWRGARPEVLDLETDQQGALLCLLFGREGDCCLLPLAWRHEQVDPELDDPLSPPLLLLERALSSEEMALAKADLEADGWHLQGRLNLYFTGRYTDNRFWQSVSPFLRDLRQEPAAGEELEERDGG